MYKAGAARSGPEVFASSPGAEVPVLCSGTGGDSGGGAANLL